MNVILVVDDVPAMVEQYTYDLERLGRYQTLKAGGGAEALEVLGREAVDCVILDLEMPGMDGLEVLRTLKERGSKVPVIVYTGTGDYDRCVRAVRRGAYAFIDKADPMPKVIREVENALEQRRLSAEVHALREQLEADTPLRGRSPAMQKLQEMIGRLAPIPSSVLITGESGVGKELVARELHRRAGEPRAEQPFITVNSAALPEQLVESELFGHERGAFTGAHKLHRGAFERAGRGTIFLDEIGELAAPVQAKLLRVLEQREVVRVGGDRPLVVGARVLAATNRDLEREARDHRFREDLYYRLNVHTIPVPPLRERLSDLPELVDHFLTLVAQRFGMRKKSISAPAVDLLMAYDWSRNNVRELRNIIERMVIAADGDVIESEHVPSEIRTAPPGRAGSTGQAAATFKELKAEAERQILVAALEQNGWHITRTAAQLGLADHASLLKIMRRHNLKHRS